MTTTHSVIVVGAGISGLVCAHALKKAGRDVLLLEASDSPGGVIRSISENGFLFECGPQSFSNTPELTTLIQELGLANQLVTAPPRAPRFLLMDHRLRHVPLSPGAFLFSSLLNWRTKLSILREPFRTTHPPLEDESIGSFVRRKFSAELLRLMAGPFVSGIYAGDPEKLSLRAAFPQLHEAEKNFGSVFRGLRTAAEAKNEPRRRPTLASFRDGNETLVRALAQDLGSSLRGEVRVTQIQRATGGQFHLTTEGVSGTEQFQSDQLVLATPTHVTGTLLRQLAPTIESSLSQIEYAPVAVVSLGYRRSDVTHPLNGFGFLVPRGANLHILGTVWNSFLFPGRAPQDHVLLTSFLGGATDPTAARLSASDLVSLTQQELSPLLGLNSLPIASHVTSYTHAIPQYNLGHLDRLAAIHSQLATIPGLHLTGNYLNGPALGACVEHSLAVAESIRMS